VYTLVIVRPPWRFSCGTTGNGVTVSANNVVFRLAGHVIVGACTSGDGRIVVGPGYRAYRSTVV
jgi:hypothetical protein